MVCMANSKCFDQPAHMCRLICAFAGHIHVFACQVASCSDSADAQFNPIALRKAKIVYNFGLSECSRGKLIGCAGFKSNDYRGRMCSRKH